MDMLNYEEFKQAVADNIKEYLPAKYEESHVEVKEVIKNNNTVLDGLLISSPDSNVSPTIYLNDYYEQYKNGTAARIYKYPFHEQLLIYAQRPDATAVASVKIWNERMFCWVNEGSKGIALLDKDYPGENRLKYVFDVSDVHKAKRIGRDPNLWTMKEEYKDAVIERLEQIWKPLRMRWTFLIFMNLMPSRRYLLWERQYQIWLSRFLWK